VKHTVEPAVEKPWWCPVWAVQRLLERRPEGAKDTLLVKEEDAGRYSGASYTYAAE
jgi:hypothetical protein